MACKVTIRDHCPILNQWGYGWGCYHVSCSLCAHAWAVVAACGTISDKVCPYCGAIEQVAWLDEGNRPGDGVWL